MGATCSSSVSSRILPAMRGSVLALITGAAFAAAGETVDFQRDIAPVFQERCYLCHGEERQRGELRLDTPEAILKGGAFGPVLKPGDPEGSSLFELISLPADDPGLMPQAGDPLAPEEIALIRAWIEQGAEFGPAADAEAVPVQPAADAPQTPRPRLEALAAAVEPAPAEALAALRDRGALAMPLSLSNPLVRAGFHLLGPEAGDDALDALAPLAEHVTWLNLANTAVTDAGLATVGTLKHLTSLHLERTGITDAGLAHLAGLEHLEYLNLYGTKVTDAGLTHLRALPSLRKLYLWQTGVTPEGAEAFRAARPEVEVNLGVHLAVAETDEAPVQPEPAFALALFFDVESCCSAARQAGNTCGHPCCVESAEKGEVCAKCNPGAPQRAELVSRFDEGSCCATALDAGEWCSHGCCETALADNTVCLMCNPGAA